jgi:hypothetical protein
MHPIYNQNRRLLILFLMFAAAQISEQLKFIGHQEPEHTHVSSSWHTRQREWKPTMCSLNVDPCPSTGSTFWSVDTSYARGRGPHSNLQGVGGSRLCKFNQHLRDLNNTTPREIVVVGGAFTAGTFLKCSEGAT